MVWGQTFLSLTVLSGTRYKRTAGQNLVVHRHGTSSRPKISQGKKRFVHVPCQIVDWVGMLVFWLKESAYYIIENW